MSSSCPDAPTKGSPTISSSRPGASPIIISRAPGLPSANTRLLAVCFSAHPSNASKAAFRSANDVIAARSGESGVDFCDFCADPVLAVIAPEIFGGAGADTLLNDPVADPALATDGDDDTPDAPDTTPDVTDVIDGRYLSSLTFGIASASAPRNASSTPISACQASWVISW